jgi:Peptidase_C39 like family
MFKLTILLSFFYLTVSAQTYPSLEGLVKIGQKQSNWCVPASLEMVLNYYNRPGLIPSQLEIYNTINSVSCMERECGCNNVYYIIDKRKVFLKDYSCKICNNGYSINSITDSTLLNILKTTYQLNNSYQLGATISWDNIKKELNNHVPLIWIVSNASGSFHAFVAFEYQEVNIGPFIEKWIHINNPLEKCKGCSYWLRFVEGDQFTGSSYSPYYVIIPKL